MSSKDKWAQTDKPLAPTEYYGNDVMPYVLKSKSEYAPQKRT